MTFKNRGLEKLLAVERVLGSILYIHYYNVKRLKFTARVHIPFITLPLSESSNYA